MFKLCLGQLRSMFLERHIPDSLVFSFFGAGVNFFFCPLLFWHRHLTEVSSSLSPLSMTAEKTGPPCRHCCCTQLNVSPLQIYIFSFSRAQCSFSPNVLNHCKLSALMVISLNGVLGRETFFGWVFFLFFFNLFNTEVLHTHGKHTRLMFELTLKWLKSSLKIIHPPVLLLHLFLNIPYLVLLYAGELISK